MAGTHIIALDVGERRIGVAHGYSDIRIAQPLRTVLHNETILDDLRTLFADERADAVVVGLPRNLSGDDTAQTGYVRQFYDRLSETTDVPVYLQDEALSSRRAEAELGKDGRNYDKAAVDALAAAFILEDYFETVGK